MRRLDFIFIAWGFVLWLFATVVFHFFGDRMLPPASSFHTTLSFLLIVPVIYGVMALMYACCRVPVRDRTRYAICTAVPGMLLDIAGIHWSGFFFPALSPEGVLMLSMWLLWAYSLILLASFRLRSAPDPA